MQTEYQPLPTMEAAQVENAIGTGYFWIEGDPFWHTISQKDSSTFILFINTTSWETDYSSDEFSIVNSLYYNLTYQLANKNVSSLLYAPTNKECSGNNNRGNTLSLKAEKLVEFLDIFFKEHGVFKNITVVGLGNGAHIAVSLLAKTRTKRFKISKLILLSPPAYPEDIDNIPFGKQFEDRISIFTNFKEAPIIKKLKQFFCSKKSLMICFFGTGNSPNIMEAQKLFLGLRPIRKNPEREAEENKGRTFETLVTKECHSNIDIEVSSKIVEFICPDNKPLI